MKRIALMLLTAVMIFACTAAAVADTNVSIFSYNGMIFHLPGRWIDMDSGYFYSEDENGKSTMLSIKPFLTTHRSAAYMNEHAASYITLVADTYENDNCDIFVDAQIVREIRNDQITSGIIKWDGRSSNKKSAFFETPGSVYFMPLWTDRQIYIVVYISEARQDDVDYFAELMQGTEIAGSYVP